MKYFIIALMVLLGPAYVWADEVSADIYLKSGQEQARKKEYKKAVESLTKAMAEAPKMIEPYVALGEVYRDTGESAEARTNFTKALDLISTAHDAAGTNTGDNDAKYKTLQTKLTGYLAEYDKTRQEFNKLNEQFSQAALALIEKYEKDNPELAMNITDKLLKINPDDIVLLAKKKEYSQQVVSDAVEKNEIVTLFPSRDFDDDDNKLPEHWSINNETIKLNWLEPGHMAFLPGKVKALNNYVINGKMKIVDANPPSYCAGIAFGAQSSAEFYFFGVANMKLALGRRVNNTSELRLLQEKRMGSDFNITDWNTLEIQVSEDMVRCFVNGTLSIEYTEDNKEALRGKIALLGSNAILEFKEITLANGAEDNKGAPANK